MSTAMEFQTWERAVLLPIKDLVLTDWNCNEMSPTQQAELVASIENSDSPDNPHFDEPLQVVPIKDDKWLVLGGEHRTKAMTALNQEQVPCVIRHDLAGKSRKELMLWSVRRNNLRGKVNAQKYAELENELINEHDMTAEAARKSMLMDGDLVKAISAANKNLKSSDETEDGDTSSSNSSDNTYETDGERENAQKNRDRSELLQALKVVEQDVLLDSADTVEHGYLFFVQGRKGQTHLVVDESNNLHSLVSKMVSACKGESARVDDFLAAAIAKELKNWE